MGKSRNTDRHGKFRKPSDKKPKKNGNKKSKQYSPFEDLPEYHESFVG